MDPPNSLHADGLCHLAEWIERHLDDSLTLEQIAKQIGLSPYHFSRLFSVRIGRRVMAHVRGGRLVKAARRLLQDPHARLIDLAFDSGFDSQEAFTRAFRRIFGVTPGRFRQGSALAPIEGAYSTAPVVQLPGLVPMKAFTVAG